MKRISIITVNRDNASFTLQLVNDLLYQSCSDFELIIVDNGSTEDARKAYNKATRLMDATVIYTRQNTPINHLWNLFAKTVNAEFVCFANNDIEISSTVIRDIIAIMDKEPEVAIVCHATNHPDILKSLPEPSYILSTNIKCGWLYTIRRKLWEPIPEEMQWFCGDDWIFQKCYDKGYKTAIAKSSPIIHYQGRTMKALGDKWADTMWKEIETLKSYGLEWHLTSDDPSILRMQMVQRLELEK